MAREAAVILPPSASWYIHQLKATYGPFTREQLIGLILERRIHREALLRDESWPAWRPLMECLDELSETEASRKAREAKTSERRVGAPRVELVAPVSARSTNVVTTAETKDISVSGIFLSTPERIFRLGETIELDLPPTVLGEGFQAKAEVMRYNANARFNVGYGLRFTEIDNRVIVAVARLVGIRPISEFGVVYSNATKPTPKE